jgi:hypothetical protein
MNNYSVKAVIAFFIVFIVSTSLCEAQFKGGASFYGFDINYNTSKTHYDSKSGPSDSDKTYGFSLMPTFGVFINSHWLVGVKASATKSTESNVYEKDYKVTDISSKGRSFGPFVRYYKMLGDRAAIFFQGEITWGKENYYYTLTDLQNTYSFDFNNKVKSNQIGIRPGIVFFIAKGLAFESTIGFIGYTKSRLDNNFDALALDNVKKDFQFSFSPSNINLGIKYYIGIAQ